MVSASYRKWAKKMNNLKLPPYDPNSPGYQSWIKRNGRYSLKYFKEVNGQTLWLAGMCSIGPFTTAKPEEALRFMTEADAMRHPAWTHPTCLLDIVPAPAVREEQVCGVTYPRLKGVDK